MIFAVKISDVISKYGISYFNNKITKQKFEKVLRMRNRKRANGMILGELMVRKLIKEFLNIDNSKIEITSNSYGRPYLKNSTAIKFNISYSNDWVVCIMDNEDVGIDIEYIYPIELNYFKNVLSDFERNYLEEEKQGGVDKLFRIWTLKECYLKALGIGLTVPLNKLSFKVNDNGWVLDSTLLEYDTNFNFKQISFDSNYVISLCTRKEYFNTKVRLIDHMQII